jgi:signal transduction histidine kinase
VLSLAEAGLAEMRALIFELRSESLATEGLVVALQKQAASLRTRHGIEVQLDLCAEPDVSLDIKEALYRIAQEALHNTIKHARARHIEIHLQHHGQQIALHVCDDGQGFDTDESFPGHLGLRSMRERAVRLGGSLAIDSTPEQGTHIRAQVPVK